MWACSQGKQLRIDVNLGMHYRQNKWAKCLTVCTNVFEQAFIMKT